jgi:transcriptional regulator with XRE-family HTH domain
VKGPDFKRWRKSLTWSQKEAAEQLGLKRRVVQYYEKGERGDKPVKIPRTVRLACFALTLGTEDYHGPAKQKDRAEDRPLAKKIRRQSKIETAKP